MSAYWRKVSSVASPPTSFWHDTPSFGTLYISELYPTGSKLYNFLQGNQSLHKDPWHKIRELHSKGAANGKPAHVLFKCILLCGAYCDVQSLTIYITPLEDSQNTFAFRFLSSTLLHIICIRIFPVGALQTAVCLCVVLLHFQDCLFQALASLLQASQRNGWRSDLKNLSK